MIMHHPNRRHEIALASVLFVLALLIGLANPGFFTASAVFDLLRSSTVVGLFALGVLVALIAGGIDVSLPAIAAFCLYTTALLGGAFPALDHPVLMLGVAGITGAVLGSLNALFIHFFALSPLIVTLGTASLIRGGLLAFVGTRIVTDLPASMAAFSHPAAFAGSGTEGAEVGGLVVSFLMFAVAAAGVAFLLGRTTLGRGIHALGGAPESARRVGLPIARLRFIAHGLAGFLAGLAGLAHASQMRNANPFDLVGTELTVIAAVVLGGASVAGGRGTVTGTVLGGLVLVLVEAGLVIVGLSSQWHKAVLGGILLLSVATTVRRVSRAAWREGMA